MIIIDNNDNYMKITILIVTALILKYIYKHLYVLVGLIILEDLMELHQGHKKLYRSGIQWINL